MLPQDLQRDYLSVTSYLPVYGVKEVTGGKIVTVEEVVEVVSIGSSLTDPRDVVSTEYSPIREYGSTLYVGLARALSPTNTNFRLTFLLTRLQEALYEDLAV